MKNKTKIALAIVAILVAAISCTFFKSEKPKDNEGDNTQQIDSGKNIDPSDSIQLEIQKQDSVQK